jgi:alpha-ketoglutarate-dependent taurine dioxygenase
MTHELPQIVDTDIVAPSAWSGDRIVESDWRLPLSSGCRRELLTVVDQLRAGPLPTLLLEADDFSLNETRRIAEEARAILDESIGLVVIDRLPIEDLTADEAKALYWLLSNLVSRVVAGAWDGRVLHDVIDTDQKQGLRVRGDLTSQEIQWHTDNGFSCPPDYFGLLCIRPAVRGGETSFASLHSAHNLMRKRHPELLPRLYRPFYWNRLSEHHPDDSPINRFPYFEYDGARLKGRFNRRIVYAGHELAGEPLVAAGRAAIEDFCGVLNDPSLRLSLKLEAGQVIYVNNSAVAHHRTPFVDSADPKQRRHLVRIYMRDHGPRRYLGPEGMIHLPESRDGRL